MVRPSAHVSSRGTSGYANGVIGSGMSGSYRIVGPVVDPVDAYP